MIDATTTLEDGRTIAYTELGDPQGDVVFYFHGAPGGRLELAHLDDAFAERHIRLVTPDRPGYGGSSPRAGRTTASWAPDVAAVADLLGAERFAVMGLSSGGPYTLAVAALLRERVVGAAIVAGNTDMTWPPARDGYLESELQIMALDDEDAAVALCEEKFGADGSGFFDGATDLGPADDAFLADESNATALFSAMREAFRQGVAGYAHDITVQGRGWSFDPADITVPVIVLHGELDRLVPIAHSRHTADLIGGTQVRMIAGRGHLSLTDELPAVAGELVAHLHR